MQITIGTKIFGIAIVLSAMMIIAAVLSEDRVRQAQVQVDVLIDEMIPLLELSAELKFLALHEQFEVSDHSTWAEIDGVEKRAVLKDDVESWASSFNSTAENMRSALRIAITTLPSVDRKLALEKLDTQLASLVTEHDTLVETVRHLLQKTGDPAPAPDRDFLDILNVQIEAFAGAHDSLTFEIRRNVDEIAAAAKEEEAIAFSFDQIVTALAASLGLLLAAILTKTIVSPIKNLHQASVAVGRGNIDQKLKVKGSDEISELSASFNNMVEQLRQKQKTEEVFGRYVDPRVIADLVNETGEDTDSLAAASKQTATVMFTDIADYTKISERLTPARLVDLMNEYFARADVPIAETGGLIDKFIGDSVMAFWSPPFVEAEMTAQLACKAALGELAMVEDLQPDIPEIIGLKTDAPTVDIRIGLATGEVIVGSIGSENKRNYTIIGDTVNLGSRLESANKMYGTRILVCENTQRGLSSEFVTREVDRLAVVGKNEAVNIFELFALDTPEQSIVDAFGAFAEGLSHYRAADWSAAETYFHSCLSAKPDDGPSLTMLERIQRLKTQSPNDWDGIWRAKNK